jgi:hypothetical protein
MSQDDRHDASELNAPSRPAPAKPAGPDKAPADDVGGGKRAPTPAGADRAPRGRRGRGGRKDAKRGKGHNKPTPARQSATDDSAPQAPTDVAEASVVVDDVEWVVRVMGRSRGSPAGAAPLLLLGFSNPDATETASTREALVVGRLLSELTTDRLRAAFLESRPPLPDDRPRRFFSDGRGRGGRNPRRG